VGIRLEEKRLRALDTLNFGGGVLPGESLWFGGRGGRETKPRNAPTKKKGSGKKGRILGWGGGGGGNKLALAVLKFLSGGKDRVK